MTHFPDGLYNRSYDIGHNDGPSDDDPYHNWADHMDAKCYRCRVNDNIGSGVDWMYCDLCADILASRPHEDDEIRRSRGVEDDEIRISRGIECMTRAKQCALPFIRDAALQKKVADDDETAENAVAALVEHREEDVRHDHQLTVR